MKNKKISELMVLQTAAGFYIGRLYYESPDEAQPYSRETQYFKTKEEAEYALEHIEDFLIEI